MIRNRYPARTCPNWPYNGVDIQTGAPILKLHTDAWCDDCRAINDAAESLEVQKANHRELKRSNDLEEQRLELEYERMQRDPASKPYVPYVPPARPKQNFTGGMQVEPRNE